MIELGSMPARVNEDVEIGRERDGQSPMRCFELAQWAQERETETVLEERSREGNFHR